MCETSSSTQFVDSLNKIWCYYEAFLGQTQMLNAAPVRELANNFLGLTVRERELQCLPYYSVCVCVCCVCVCQTLYEQVLEYRGEQLKAAEKLSVCRHSSKLTDVSSNNTQHTTHDTTDTQYTLLPAASIAIP